MRILVLLLITLLCCGAVSYTHLDVYKRQGIKLTFEDSVFEYIVDKAVEYKLGARGLRSICLLYTSQKRVAIARAIALNPQYLFCDEPNSGLDPKTSLVIDDLIHDITQAVSYTHLMLMKIAMKSSTQVEMIS